MTRLKLSVAFAALAASGVFTTTAFGAVDPSAVSSAVSTAISGSTANGPSAVTQAIKEAAKTQLNGLPPGEVTNVIAQIIADAIADGATPQEIGQALGQLALELGAPDSTLIADAVGEGGDTELLAAFDTTVASAVGGAALASEADAHSGGSQPSGPLSVGAVVSVGGGVSGAGGGINGSACVETSPNQCP